MALAAEHHRRDVSRRPSSCYRRVLQTTSAQRRCDAPARFDRAQGRSCRRGGAACSSVQSSIAPDFLLALLDLGQLRKEQDRFAEALECFDRAIALDPGMTRRRTSCAALRSRPPRSRTKRSRRIEVPDAASDARRRAARARPPAQGCRPLRLKPSPPTTPASASGPTPARPTGASPTSRPTGSTTKPSRRWRRARAAGSQRAVRGELPVCARQGARGPRRLRARLGLSTARATRSSARRSLRPGADGGR